MTREELGRHGWSMLHMISATIPIDFDEDFAQKINVFLNLL
jgi:FAD-linked sulfhydryl oxidase